jgi:hypothetical protein
LRSLRNNREAIVSFPIPVSICSFAAVGDSAERAPSAPFPGDSLGLDSKVGPVAAKRVSWETVSGSLVFVTFLLNGPVSEDRADFYYGFAPDEYGVIFFKKTLVKFFTMRQLLTRSEQNRLI